MSSTNRTVERCNNGDLHRTDPGNRTAGQSCRYGIRGCRIPYLRHRETCAYGDRPLGHSKTNEIPRGNSGGSTTLLAGQRPTKRPAVEQSEARKEDRRKRQAERPACHHDSTQQQQ